MSLRSAASRSSDRPAVPDLEGLPCRTTLERTPALARRCFAGLGADQPAVGIVRETSACRRRSPSAALAAAGQASSALPAGVVRRHRVRVRELQRSRRARPGLASNTSLTRAGRGIVGVASDRAAVRASEFMASTCRLERGEHVGPIAPVVAHRSRFADRRRAELPYLTVVARFVSALTPIRAQTDTLPTRATTTMNPCPARLSAFARGLTAETAFDVLAVAKQAEGRRQGRRSSCRSATARSPARAQRQGGRHRRPSTTDQTHYCPSLGPAGVPRGRRRELSATSSASPSTAENVVVGPGPSRSSSSSARRSSNPATPCWSSARTSRRTCRTSTAAARGRSTSPLTQENAVPPGPRTTSSSS